jgi:hypothetical protein
MVDIVMEFEDNWDNMDQLARNPDDIPIGTMEMIYNSAIEFNIINEDEDSL